MTSTLNSDIEGGALRRLGSPDLECFPDCKQILDSRRSEDAEKDSSLPQSEERTDNASHYWKESPMSVSQ